MNGPLTMDDGQRSALASAMESLMPGDGLLGIRSPDLSVARSLPLIYVAGPFRGANSWAMECNIRMAERVALAVWCAGAVAICPHLNTRFFQGRLPDQTFIDGTLAMMLGCDGMVVLPTWPWSDGTCGEILGATAAGLPYRILEWSGDVDEATIDWEVRRALTEMAIDKGTVAAVAAPPAIAPDDSLVHDVGEGYSVTVEGIDGFGSVWWYSGYSDAMEAFDLHAQSELVAGRVVLKQHLGDEADVLAESVY